MSIAVLMGCRCMGALGWRERGVSVRENHTHPETVMSRYSSGSVSTWSRQDGGQTSDEESWMKLQVLIQAAGDLNTIKILINGEKSHNITEERWQLI